MTTTQLVDLNTTKIDTAWVISQEQNADNMAYAISKIKGRLEPGPLRGDDRIAVVCYGPSLKDEWEKLKEFKWIISCSGAHKFLVDRDIIPTWHVDVDPRPHKIDLMGKPHPDVTYLPISSAHKKYIDHLDGYKTLLWHGFQGDDLTTLPIIFPRGEWVFAGGCTVGLRALLIARFLGFTKMALFGMDCSYPDGNTGEHAAHHPNPAKDSQKVSTIYNGVKYNTTLGMVEGARQFFKEIALLKDCEIMMYGEGMLQDMAKGGWSDPNFNPVHVNGVIAFKAPNLYTDQYLNLNKQLHQQNPNYGISGSRYSGEVLKLVDQYKTDDILDYGCGKGTLAKSLQMAIKEYDPAIEGKNANPAPADIVVCTDVLEHIEPDYIDWVIRDLGRCTKKVAFIVIHTGPAQKTLPDGRNTHLIQENKAWWWKKLNQAFDIDEMLEDGPHLSVWCKPKGSPATIEAFDKEQLSFNYAVADGVKYVTVNHHTEWRVETLKTKEPATMAWLEGMSAGDILFDVGANVGMYTLWVAKNRGVNVYAFEAESQNYALLTQNIYINEISDKVKAYNMAVGDKVGPGELRLTEFMPGSSCHQLDSHLDWNGRPKEFAFNQACFTVSIDWLVDNGYMPQPTHIKIDIDGLEPLVVYGAIKTLRNVESVLIEVNDNLPEHKAMVKLLGGLGFWYDQNQVNMAVRKSGTFTGVGEYVFRRS